MSICTFILDFYAACCNISVDLIIFKLSPIVFVTDSKINIALDTASNESGIHISEIAKGVSGQGFSEGDVRNSINHLSNEGHIYSTIDEHHYQYAM